MAVVASECAVDESESEPEPESAVDALTNTEAVSVVDIAAGIQNPSHRAVGAVVMSHTDRETKVERTHKTGKRQDQNDGQWPSDRTN